jgi:hypothetical protein
MAPGSRGAAARSRRAVSRFPRIDGIYEKRLKMSGEKFGHDF